jgi:hypothetical protein
MSNSIDVLKKLGNISLEEIQTIQNSEGTRHIIKGKNRMVFHKLPHTYYEKVKQMREKLKKQVKSK